MQINPEQNHSRWSEKIRAQNCPPKNVLQSRAKKKNTRENSFTSLCYVSKERKWSTPDAFGDQNQRTRQVKFWCLALAKEFKLTWSAATMINPGFEYRRWAFVRSIKTVYCSCGCTRCTLGDWNSLDNNSWPLSWRIIIMYFEEREWIIEVTRHSRALRAKKSPAKTVKFGRRAEPAKNSVAQQWEKLYNSSSFLTNKHIGQRCHQEGKHNGNTGPWAGTQRGTAWTNLISFAFIIGRRFRVFSLETGRSGC